MKEKWQKLESWLAANAPKVLEPLNPPASEAEIAATEAAIGMSLPPSVRDSYEVHNGEKNVWGLFATWQFLPLEEVVGTIEEMEQIEAEYQFGDFDTSLMIPILRSGGGDLYYVERSYNGEETELIEWWHEDPSRDVKAASFEAFFDEFLQRLESGAVVFDEECGGLVEKEDQ